uniref:General transcription factor II-I repeat domain-containing protein 2-like n=1 Tax=Diabrotica virgifera virgifera TaxID=50390 RepID=A0A6P7FFX5_DIAVI
MKTVVQIVNSLRGGNRAQRHRKFISFLEELNTEYKEVPLHSEIRWLSAGKCLRNFFSLRKEIVLFFETEIVINTDVFITKLKNKTFFRELAFLTDITSHLNTLNLQLQGKNKTVSQLVSQIEIFRKKLDLFENCMKINDLNNFPACLEINQEETMVDFSRFAKVLTEIQREFDERFSEFDAPSRADQFGCMTVRFQQPGFATQNLLSWDVCSVVSQPSTPTSDFNTDEFVNNF